MTRTIRAESMRASGKLRCKCGTERKSIDYIIGGTNVISRVSDLMLPWDDNASTNIFQCLLVTIKNLQMISIATKR